MQEPVPQTTPAPDLQGVRPSLVQLTHFIYGLHAIAVIVGITSAATIAGGFVFGLPSLCAVFLNYLKRSDVNGTWLVCFSMACWSSPSSASRSPGY